MEKFPNEIIERIIQGHDIVDLVSQYVSLEKQGRNYFGICPFHSEKTPSFSVSKEKQIFHCFSCGEGGNVIQFLEKIEHISHNDSVKRLAQNLNLNVSQYTNEKSNFSLYYEINQFVADYYQFALQNTVDGKKALEYLYSRQIDDELIKRFKIGFSPNSVNSLYMALKANGYSELAMVELGHVTKSNEQYYDKFKNRIMFPISDDYSNIVGFSGRIFQDEGKKEPKYINTQETPIFKKGEIIYHLDYAKKAIRQEKKVFLFEGFMDVISSYKSGLEASVATMGTALSDDHVKLLKNYTNHIVLCYDGDQAGIEATKRALPIIEKQNMKINVIHLPDGLDPDDYVKKFGKELYIDYIKTHQISYKDYLYQSYFHGIDPSNIQSLEDVKRKIFALLIGTSPTENELYLNKLSRDINVSLETLKFDFVRFSKFKQQVEIPTQEDIIQDNAVTRKINGNRPSAKKLIATQETMLIMILKNRKFLSQIENNHKIKFFDENFRNISYLLKSYYDLYDVYDHETFTTKFLIHNEILKVPFLKIYKKFLLDTVEYSDQNMNECFAVIRRELVAIYNMEMRIQMKSAPTDEEQLFLGQKVIDQNADLKSNKNK